MTEEKVRSIYSFRAAAMRYVDSQVDIMEKYGSITQLSAAEYYALVDEVAAVGRKLWLNSGGEISDGSLGKMLTEAVGKEKVDD